MIRLNRKPITLLLLTCVIIIVLYQNFSTQSSEKSQNEIPKSQKKSYNTKLPEKIDRKRVETECGKVLKLDYFPEKNPDKNEQTFFIETSNVTVFKGRQLCAIESAIRNGKLPVKVILRSPILPLNHPALCSLIEEFYPHRLNFYTSSLDALFSYIPIQGITSRLEWANRAFKSQLSDMMRASLLFKYGGFYLDNDVLTLKDLTGVRNSIVLDYKYSVPSPTCELQNEEKSNMLNQGSMHFEKGNPFILEYLRILNREYKDGMNWIQTGPPLMHRAAAEFLGKDGRQESVPVRTPDLTIFPSFVFRLYMPHLPPPSPKLFDVNVNSSVFEEFMRCSYLIHLSGPWSKNSVIDGNPRRDIYSYLGPKVCPTSFSQLNVF